MAIGALVTMTAKAGAEQELLERVTDVIADVRTEPGNLLAVAMRAPDDPSRIFLFEIYRDQQAIAEHKAARHTIEKGPPLQALFGAPIESRLFETVD